MEYRARIGAANGRYKGKKRAASSIANEVDARAGKIIQMMMMKKRRADLTAAHADEGKKWAGEMLQRVRTLASKRQRMRCGAGSG